MPEKLSVIKVFVSSPGDVLKERNEIDNIVKEINLGEQDVKLEVIKWETHITPGYLKDGVQEKINKEIGLFDIFLGIMCHRFGTPTKKADSGTEEEFKNACKLWQKIENPNILFYFCQNKFTTNSAEAAEQFAKVQRFKEDLWKKNIIVGEYTSLMSFGNKVRPDLKRILNNLVGSPRQYKTTRKRTLTKKGVKWSSEEIVIDNVDKLLVPGQTEIYSSFQPIISKQKENRKNANSIKSIFYKIKAPTTPGFVGNKSIENEVHIIKDPIRPYDIQVGLTRSKRKGGNPEAIPELTNLDKEHIERMYPFLQGNDFKWVRMVLAELSNDQEVLKFINENDKDSDVNQIAAKNPSAPNEIKKDNCRFCDPVFKDDRRRYESTYGTIIMANDFPYGPLFHYIAFPKEPVHSWEDLNEAQISDMNHTISIFLKRQKENVNNLNQAAGVFIGLNSSIRHLVLGKKTKSSAGASISHVHKQIWGMAPGSVNLGNHLSKICASYQKEGVDYLKSYLKALEKAGLILYIDKNVALFIPFGQITVHELQIMILRKGTENFLDLTPEEIDSLSRAEYIVTRIYEAMQIGSFNEVVIHKPFSKNFENKHTTEMDKSTFRLMMVFLTREIDIAVSELNHLYVVDKYPENTYEEIKRVWPKVKIACRLEYGL